MEVESLGESRYRVSARGAGVRVHLKEELCRFLDSLAASGSLTPEARARGPGELVEEYMRRYQEEAAGMAEPT